ncbi:MAG: hypothetical protein IJ762_10405 [Bacteroidaceae bacterium]|nr:hypothetical protein [Bacteroidaceae bacterium]
MSAIAQRIKDTPMAPYIGLMRGMSRHDIQIVVTFLNEVMEEAEESETVPMTNAEIIREKYKNLRISPRAKALVEGLSLSEEEMEDERTKYILGL